MTRSDPNPGRVYKAHSDLLVGQPDSEVEPLINVARHQPHGCYAGGRCAGWARELLPNASAAGSIGYPKPCTARFRIHCSQGSPSLPTYEVLMKLPLMGWITPVCFAAAVGVATSGCADRDVGPAGLADTDLSLDADTEFGVYTLEKAEGDRFPWGTMWIKSDRVNLAGMAELRRDGSFIYRTFRRDVDGNSCSGEMGQGTYFRSGGVVEFTSREDGGDGRSTGSLVNGVLRVTEISPTSGEERVAVFRKCRSTTDGHCRNWIVTKRDPLCSSWMDNNPAGS